MHNNSHVLGPIKEGRIKNTGGLENKTKVIIGDVTITNCFHGYGKRSKISNTRK